MGIGALTTGYACNCNAKEITILFCKQIGRSPNTSYAKCRMGFREGKMDLEEPVRVASPTRINLEEPVRVRPAQPG